MDIIKPKPSNYVPLVKENTTKTILVKNKVMRTRNGRLTTAIISSMLEENENENLSYELVIREQPKNVKSVGLTDKERKPIEPPLIVQLSVYNEKREPYVQCLYNSNFFILATLLEEKQTIDETGKYTYKTLLMDKYKDKKLLLGTTVASMNRLKDVDGSNGAFFIFYDLSIRYEGSYRLKFSLYEMKQNKTIYRSSTVSDVFTVYSPKAFPGFKESSALAKSFAEQGVKIRIKKDVNVPRTRYSKYSNDIWLNDNGEILSKEGFLLKKKLLNESESEHSESSSVKSSQRSSPIMSINGSGRSIPIKQESSFIPVNIKADPYKDESTNDSYGQYKPTKYEINPSNNRETFIPEKSDGYANIRNKKDYPDAYPPYYYDRNNTIQNSKRSNDYNHNQNIKNNTAMNIEMQSNRYENNNNNMQTNKYENNNTYYDYHRNERENQYSSYTRNDSNGRPYENASPNYYGGYNEKEKMYNDTYGHLPSNKINNEEKMDTIPRSNNNRNLQRNIPLSISDGEFSRNIPYSNNIPNYRNEPSETDLNLPSTRGSSYIENKSNHYPSPIENPLPRDTNNTYNRYENSQYDNYRINTNRYGSGNKPSVKRSFEVYEQDHVENNYKYGNGSPNNKSSNNGYRSPDSKTSSEEDFNQSLLMNKSTMDSNMKNRYSPFFSSRSVPDTDHNEYIKNSYIPKEDCYGPTNNRNYGYYRGNNDYGNNKNQPNGNYSTMDIPPYDETNCRLSSNTREYCKTRSDNDYNCNPKERETILYRNEDYSNPPSKSNGYAYQQPPSPAFNHHKDLPEPIPYDNTYSKRDDSSLKPIRSDGYENRMKRREGMPQRSCSYNEMSHGMNEREDKPLRAGSYDDRFKRRRINPSRNDYFERNMDMEYGQNEHYEKYQNLTPNYSNKGSTTSSNVISLQVNSNTPMSYNDDRFTNSRSSNNSDSGYPGSMINRKETRYQDNSKAELNKFCYSPQSMEISGSNDNNPRYYNNNSNNNLLLPDSRYSEKEKNTPYNNTQYKGSGNYHNNTNSNYQRESFITRDNHSSFKNNIRDIINQENVSYRSDNERQSSFLNMNDEFKPYSKTPSNFDMRISRIVIENSV
jgi:hypothetical protein